MGGFSTFVVWFLLASNAGWMLRRAWTLAFESQSGSGRGADMLLILLYGAIVIGLWPLTFGG